MWAKKERKEDKNTKKKAWLGSPSLAEKEGRQRAHYRLRGMLAVISRYRTSGGGAALQEVLDLGSRSTLGGKMLREYQKRPR